MISSSLGAEFADANQNPSGSTSFSERGVTSSFPEAEFADANQNESGLTLFSARLLVATVARLAS